VDGALGRAALGAVDGALGRAALGAVDGALGRAARRARDGAAPAAERCGLCAVRVPGTHRHLLDEERAELLCACRACTLLFGREAASRGHYVLVPDRRLALPGFSARALGLPVGLAFFVVQADGSVLAHYPSPIGITQGEVDPARWSRARDQCAELGTLRPRVEAVLVNTARGADEHWIVPLDLCYRLVALIRTEWRGLSGGSTVWPAISAFFAALAGGPGRPAPAPAGLHGPLARPHSPPGRTGTALRTSTGREQP
jgi:hypothetical protein